MHETILSYAYQHGGSKSKYVGFGSGFENLPAAHKRRRNWLSAVPHSSSLDSALSWTALSFDSALVRIGVLFDKAKFLKKNIEFLKFYGFCGNLVPTTQPWDISKEIFQTVVWELGKRLRLFVKIAKKPMCNDSISMQCGGVEPFFGCLRALCSSVASMVSSRNEKKWDSHDALNLTSVKRKLGSGRLRLRTTGNIMPLT